MAFSTFFAVPVLSLNSKLVFRKSDGASNTYGRYITIDDTVIALLIINATDTIDAWTNSIGVPKPKYGAFGLKDVMGLCDFQINNYGIFQNASTLAAGTYIVNAIYVK